MAQTHLEAGILVWPGCHGGMVLYIISINLLKFQLQQIPKHCQNHGDLNKNEVLFLSHHLLPNAYRKLFSKDFLGVKGQDLMVVFKQYKGLDGSIKGQLAVGLGLNVFKTQSIVRVHIWWVKLTQTHPGEKEWTDTVFDRLQKGQREGA